MSQAARTLPPAAPLAPAPDAPLGAPRPPYGVAAIVALGVFLLYWLTLGPTTWFWDTSEYIATAHITGIPHPPGNPLFVLLARAWDALLAPLGIPVAQRINLFSAFMTTGASFFWFLTVHRILSAFSERELVRRVGAGVAVLVSATAFTVWNQATVNEKVYTVSLFTIAALTWIAFLWRDHVEAHRAPRGGGTSRWHDDNALILGVFLLALSVGNHLMAFLAFPALLVFVLLVKPQALFNWRLYVYALVFGFVGLSVHLFLPIRSGLGPVINQAAPSCPDITSAVMSIVGFGRDLPGACEELTAALAREQYQKPSVFERLSPLKDQLAVYFQYFDWQWARSISGAQGWYGAGRIFVTLVFLSLGIHGAVEHFRRDRKSFWYVFTLFATLSFGLVYYMNFRYGYGQARALGISPELGEVRERDYFFLVSFSLWGLWVGVGLTALWMTLADVIGGRGNRRWALASPVFLLALVPLVFNWPYASRKNDYAARDLAYNMLQSVEPYGVLFTNGDNDTFPLWYLQEVEGIRRDVTVIVLSYLNTDWYVRQLRDLTRPCPTQGAWKEDVTRIICQRDFDPADAPDFYDALAARKPTKSIFDLDDAGVERVANTPPYLLQQDAVLRVRGMEATIRAGKPIYAADEFLLRIVQGAWGDRPIYFAATTNAQYELGFGPHIERQGLAFKLVSPDDARSLMRMPQEQGLGFLVGSYMDPERNRRLLEEVFQFHGLENKPYWTDDATRNIPMHFSYGFQAMAILEQIRGNAAAVQKYDARAQAFARLSDR